MVRRLPRGVLVVLAAAGTVGSVLAGPARAHVEVFALPAAAGATGALVNFHASGESNTAGVVAITVTLPAGIPPASVSLAGGPPGWRFQPTAVGYLLAGPPLPKGMPGRYQVRIARLPDAPSLRFDTVVRYADGTQDAWTEPTRRGEPAPAHPAPVLALTGASDRASAGPVRDGASGGFREWAWLAAAGVGAALLALRLAVRRRTDRTDRTDRSDRTASGPVGPAAAGEAQAAHR